MVACFSSSSKSQDSSPHEPLACPLCWLLFFLSSLLHMCSMAAAAPATLSIFEAGRKGGKLCLSPATILPPQDYLSQMPTCLLPQTLHWPTLRHTVTSRCKGVWEVERLPV